MTADKVQVVVSPRPASNVAGYTPFPNEVTDIITRILEDDERQPSKEPDYPVNRVFSSGGSVSSSSALTTPLEPSTAAVSQFASNPFTCVASPKKKSRKVRTTATRVITPVELPSSDDENLPLPLMTPRRESTAKPRNGNAAMEPVDSDTAAHPEEHTNKAPADDVWDNDVPGEDDIFGAVGDLEKNDVLIWIASHEFMQNPSQPVSRYARLRFIEQLETQSKAAGLDDTSISKLIAYVRWNYLDVCGLSGLEIKSFVDPAVFGKEIDDTAESQKLSMSPKALKSLKRRRSTETDIDYKRQKISSSGSSSSFHTANETSDSVMRDASESPSRGTNPMSAADRIGSTSGYLYTVPAPETPQPKSANGREILFPAQPSSPICTPTKASGHVDEMSYPYASPSTKKAHRRHSSSINPLDNATRNLVHERVTSASSPTGRNTSICHSASPSLSADKNSSRDYNAIAVICTPSNGHKAPSRESSNSVRFVDECKADSTREEPESPLSALSQRMRSRRSSIAALSTHETNGEDSNDVLETDVGSRRQQPGSHPSPSSDHAVVNDRGKDITDEMEKSPVSLPMRVFSVPEDTKAAIFLGTLRQRNRQEHNRRDT
ncbi:hypothetical protein N7468_002117 [Penicillium chermesinum]|uniref:Uncharacterized protein n=1 Tax=Penicillium chermesinum TaxID=63820 RepID=A0A9W9TZA0_9EURO|nr:uncharacterized protein N7468_002117 [Penicillium chermesinum]KAJ5247134.1 hypothetical protein N7468_002117 [Penicillium chermesinum]